MWILGAVAVVGLVLRLGVGAIRRPGSTILPVYAAVVPVGSAFALSIPVPAPFNSVSSALGAVAAIACLLHVLWYGRARAPRLPIAGWSVLLAWAAATVFWAVDPGISLQLLPIAVSLVGLVFATSLVPFDERDHQAFSLGVIAGGIAVGVYAAYLVARGLPLPTHGVSQRFAVGGGGGETDPNILAASLLLPLAFSVERLLLGGRGLLPSLVWRLIGAAGVGLTLLALVLTGSRGGLIAAAAALGVTLVAAATAPGAALRVKAVVAAIAVVAALGTAGLFAARDEVSTLIGGPAAAPIERVTSIDTNGSGRAEIWKTGFLACASVCGVGAGLGNFSAMYNLTTPYAGLDKNVGPDRPAHDIYLQLAVDTGIIGLLLFALALLLEGRVLLLRRVRAMSPGLLGGVLAVLVANVFLSTIWFKYFWLVFIAVRVVDAVSERVERGVEAPRTVASLDDPGVGRPRPVLLPPAPTGAQQ